MNEYGYIYKTTNILNNKVYIGKKKGEFNPEYFGSGLILKRAIEKEGLNNFKLEVIAYGLTREQVNEFEKNTISKYRELLGKENIYNIASGGEGGDLLTDNPNREKIINNRRSKEFAEKWVKTRIENAKIKGYFSSPETCQKRSKAMLGKSKSEEHKTKICKALLGRHHSEETKAKMRKPKSETHKAKLRKPKSEKARKNIKEAANRPEVISKRIETRQKNGKCWHSEETKQHMRKSHRPHPIDCMCASCVSHRNKLNSTFISGRVLTL